MPPIGQLLGGVDFSQLAINLNQDGSAAIRYGEFLNAVITFVIIAFVVWSLSRAFIREEARPAVKDCPYCLEVIPQAATKCRACGSNVAA